MQMIAQKTQGFHVPERIGVWQVFLQVLFGHGGATLL
jgi:hypothetical protein